jgi:chromosome segregation ATPase
MGTETIAAVATDARGSRVRARTVVVAVAVGLVVVGGFVCARLWFDRQADLDDVRAQQHRSERALAQRQQDAAAARAGLRAAHAVLIAEVANLAARTTERDDSATTLVGTNQHLSDLRAQLAAAAGDLQSRTTQLGALEQCVLGVARALNQASVGDVVGLGSTLGRIEGTCATAGVTL